MAEPKQAESKPVATAPEPKKKVAVAWPTSRFVVEGLPVVTQSGVAVTADQRKKLEVAAKRSGVTLREVND